MTPTSALEYDPQKALLVAEPPTGPQWVHELKLDGFRMGLVISGRSVRLISRRGTDYTSEFPEIVDAARKLRVKRAVIDGEVVVLDEHGVSRFQLLQQLGANRRGLAYFAFDLLRLDATNFAARGLEERKRALLKLVGRRAGIIRYNPHFDTDGKTFFDTACRLGAEGIISKCRDAPYRNGSRSYDWQKIKCVKRQEFVIGGFTDPEGSRVGIGSLLAGYYEGKALRFAGKVGTGVGWSDAFGRSLRKKLEAIEIDESPFDPPPRGWLGKNAHWVRPRLVAEVQFGEWTDDGKIRHPSLQGFRKDKKARDVVREKPVIPSEGPKGRSRGISVTRRDSSRAQRAPAPLRRSARNDKRDDDAIVYPRAKLHISDLVDLYTDIADVALPHVLNRPLTLVRMRQPITRDDALRTQAVFAHHTLRDQAFIGDAVPRIKIPELKKIGEYRYVDSLDALLALLRAGVAEWHVWNATIDKVERPDRVVFDLDPGDGVSWKAVVAAARTLRAFLEQLDLESWVKTTGGKGLHVVVPFRREHDWDAVFAFSHAVANALAAANPKSFTASFDRSERNGKVLIDYKRNHRTSIAVAGYSLRARPDAAIAVPVRWDEIARLAGGARFNANNIRERVRRQKEDPWAGYWIAKQRLKPTKGGALRVPLS